MSWQHLDANGVAVESGRGYYCYTANGLKHGVVVWDAKQGFIFHPDDGGKPHPLPFNQRPGLELRYNTIQKG